LRVDDRLAQLLALAWRVVPAADANEAIDRARRSGDSAREASEHAARTYELVLGADATLESFARDQLPKLVYHLETVGAHLPDARGVLLAIFAGERLHFLRAGEAVGKLCELLGIATSELVERYGTGERRTAVQLGPRLALPAEKKS
jgi:hypothetical protein